ncbi:MAG: type I restriction endonuclease subunit R [Nanoarchaeota archaeon]|nr:type I restriction endonuclease subunit R [Nanoarchaeota archaeon]MBU1321909.1 type I restriction endonuclease subunit R [Nanoarchaeota archaeon]MBU1598432.1 type I restriction endonuclease subunit R [Nanoarchaeota archaeon]MBU2441058.1 type I restriction endonuclease subunit R [Nanoarchaeota archaeon]
MTKFMNEEEIEKESLSILQDLGYEVLYGPDCGPESDNPLRKSYSEVVLVDKLKQTIAKLNPNIPASAREEALKKVLRTESPDLLINNQRFHNLLVNGVPVQYRDKDRIKDDMVWLIDFNNPKKNEFLAINQFTIIEKDNRRPDVIIFINGLPLVVLEFKNPADEKAGVKSAYNQFFNTYIHKIPSLFQYNEILIASDGLDARAGTISSKFERFMPWKKASEENKYEKKLPQIYGLTTGMFSKITLLDLIRNFIIFEKKKEGSTKILAAYHQYYATNKALDSTIKAIKPSGDKRGGVVWHTQGSGKSLTMVFYTGKVVLDKSLENPTIVVITDRNDLDDQLFNTFGNCQDLLRQKPVQAESRTKLKDLLSVASGGVVFTTIQKFSPEETGDQFPLLSDRRNIIVIADEAHRTQYGFKAKVVQKDDKAKVTYGFAKHIRDALPNASFIGFTGTPIEKTDRSTPAVFGNIIDTYDIQQAVTDKATVRILYESRLARIELNKNINIDKDFEEVTEGEEEKAPLKSKWSQLAAVVGNEKRIKQIAKDIISHFGKRLEALEGKAMIVCMSRRICVDLYNEIIKLKPEWHDEDDKKGEIKIIMTGSASDPKEWQEHIRNKPRRRALGDRFKDDKDPFKIAIVRDMWLTGFDVPSLHTMYIDKPMKEHTLMQAIARVNRVYKDKEGGLIVDYLGIAHELKKALFTYTESGGKGNLFVDQREAVALMLEKFEIVQGIMHGFNYKKFFKVSPKEKMQLILDAEEHILNPKLKDGKKRYIKYVTELSKAFALAVPQPKAMEIKDEVGFFQAVKARLIKLTTDRAESGIDYDSAVKQIVSEAIVTKDVIDIFDAAGLKKPDLSILSESFLAEVRGMKHKNVAVELLKRLLNDEIRIRLRKNIVMERRFSEMLENAIRKYQNRAIETVEVIETLIEIAKRIEEAKKRGEELNLDEDEMAFYDALSTNKSAIDVMGNEKLAVIATELLEKIQKNVKIDWSERDSVKAKIRLMVKKILKRYKYPPDLQQKAIQLILEQAKRICKELAEKE